MRKILFLIDSLSGIGGAQKSSISYINQISEQYDCYILTEEGSNREGVKAKFICFKNGKRKSTLFINRFMALCKAVIDIKPDFVHAQFSQFGFVLMIYNVLIGKSKTKCIFTDRDFYDAYNKKYHFVFKWIGKYMYKIVCTTQKNAFRWKTETGVERIAVIPNVLDPDSWKKYDIQQEKEHEKITVGFVGRYVPFKRWDIAYDIANKLNSKGVRFVFAISSIVNSDGHDAYIYKLKKKLDDVEVLFNADEETMSNLYYKMDIFVVTSENESFGRTIIEAMSRNTAVIGSDSGGVPEVIGRRKNLFKTGDVEGAVRLIEELMTDKKLLEESKKYGLERVEKVYSPDMQKKLILRLYEEE